MKAIHGIRNRMRIAGWCHGVVLLLSIMLVVYISVDTFKGWTLMQDGPYMEFQLFVCIVFMADFFLELWLSRDRKRFFRHNFVFLLVAIPYLNIIQMFNLTVKPDIFYYLRFMPLLRGAYVLVKEVSYLSRSRVVSLFWSYISVMALALYFGSLMFYWREHLINPGIKTFGDSLLWCASQITTLGSDIAPATNSGCWLAAGLAVMGTLMFPLFTVYLTAIVRKYIKASKAK